MQRTWFISYSILIYLIYKNWWYKPDTSMYFIRYQ